MLPTPAYNSEITYMYLARGLSFDKQSLDPDEFLDVVKMPLSEALSLVMDGTIRDGKTQIVLLKAARMLGI
jgi:ADP-ribose pyrophosphatase